MNASRESVKDLVTVCLADVEAVMTDALLRHGASHVVASTVARSLARAEQRGNTSCGLGHLGSDCAQLLSGRVNGTSVPALTEVRPGVLQVDARCGFVQPAFALGLPEALVRAKQLGVAILGIRRAHTSAALGHLPEQIAEKGFIGIAFTNASASVAAPGGSRPLLGTNPIAMSVPDGKGGIAFQFDQCTSAANLRAVREAASEGRAIPDGWAVGRDGQPTTDAVAALEGALLPAGGSRGFGMGLMAEVLASFYTASAMSMDTRSLQATEGAPHALGVCCLLIDPTVMAGDGFWFDLSRLRDAVGAEPATRLPGTRRSAGREISVQRGLWQSALQLTGRGMHGR